MTLIRAVDIETTGLTPPEAGVCEVGWTDLTSIPPENTNWHVGLAWSEFVNPRHPIPPTTSAIHHIVDADVKGAPTFDVVMERMLSDNPDALCAHNARFEAAFITTTIPFICTYKVALHLAPNAPAHNLQTLRYWLGLAVPKAEAEPPHRAGPDTAVTAHLLRRMLAKLTVGQMIEISSRPALLPRLTFGKHQGIPIADVPTGYLEWLTKQADMDEDVVYTARHYLNR